MGDLSAQSNNRFQTPLSPYRHAAPLEMTYGAGSSTVMGKGNNDTIPPPHCHFDRNGAKRSGVEKSPAPCCRPIAMGDLSAQSNNRFQTPLSPYRHAAPLEMTYGAGSSTVMGKGNNDTIPPPHCHFDRNGAKRSGVEKSPAPCCRPIAIGYLSAQSNNKFQIPLSPCRYAAPLEMTEQRTITLGDFKA